MRQHDQTVEVVRVGLADVSWQTHRELNGLNPKRYPVIVQLSRALDPFEALALNRIQAMVRQIPDQPGLAVIPETTLELVKNSMILIQRELADAVVLAGRLRTRAAAADLEMANLVTSINSQLGADRLPDPLEIAPRLSPEAVVRVMLRSHQGGALSIGA